MAEKKTTTTKATACKKTAAATTKRTCAAKATKAAATVSISAENVGFRAGDVYQALASEQKALSAKVANISETEVLLGAGWLLKEGKIKGENDIISLA